MKFAMNEYLIRKGIAELGIKSTEKQIQAFFIYLEELKKWNRAHNLTALKTDREIIIKHFLDSLLFIKVLPCDVQTIADVGSGAGFPGIPLKIIKPHLKVFLIEPTKKKAVFLRHICNKLGLEQIEIIEKRIEDIDDIKVDAALTRALFSIDDFVKKAGGILNQNGVLILSKGPKIEEELKKIEMINISGREFKFPVENMFTVWVPDPIHLSVKDFKLPIENTTRHLVIIKFDSAHI